jgi:hypothetical protein
MPPTTRPALFLLACTACTPARTDLADATTPDAGPISGDTAADDTDTERPPEDDPDADDDGYRDVNDGGDDCDDSDPDIHPGAEDVPYDGVDSDCDGWPDDDADRDGWPASGGDCDDDDPATNPGATESCNGLDDDCDDVIDPPSAVAGDAPECASASCLQLWVDRPDLPDGTYWISPFDAAIELVCEMSGDVPGWTLVANFLYPGSTAGVPGWTSGLSVGTTTFDTTQTYKLSDDEINELVTLRYRARGTATTCMQDDHVTVGACTVDTTLYWSADCVYESGASSTGACTAAYGTYDLQDWTTLSNPCAWHYGLTSADCGVTSEFGTSHSGDHVFAGNVGTFVHAYDGRPSEDPNVQVWVR